MNDNEARELVGRIEALLDGADDAANELVAALLDLYGEGLARVVARLPDPAVLAGDEVDYKYENMEHWGNEMFVTPGVVVDGELVTHNLVDINLGIRILLGSSYYEDWQNEETFVPKDPLGNPVDKRHPWNQTTIPKPQKRDLEGGNYSWVMSPRWYDKRTGDHLALDTGGGALARLWVTALANKV